MSGNLYDAYWFVGGRSVESFELYGCFDLKYDDHSVVWYRCDNDEIPDDLNTTCYRIRKDNTYHYRYRNDVRNCHNDCKLV